MSNLQELDIDYMFKVSKLMDLLNEQYHLLKHLHEIKHNERYPISQEQFLNNYLENLKNPPAKQSK